MDKIIEIFEFIVAKKTTLNVSTGFEDKVIKQ
jgi:hypothetical protein